VFVVVFALGRGGFRHVGHVSWCFTAACFIVIGMTSVGAAQRPDDRAVPSENIESGRDTYAFHCAACHGRAGKGDGPVAPTLRAAPPDLTTIARRRGGRFPQAEVTALIVGRRPAAHGSSDMPVWGPLFRELNPFDSKVDVRLLRLVDHLQSIQIK
jgi:mono/diheme cytochrome c family protein